MAEKKKKGLMSSKDMKAKVNSYIKTAVDYYAKKAGLKGKKPAINKKGLLKAVPKRKKKMTEAADAEYLKGVEME